MERFADFYLRGQDGWREGERDGRAKELPQFSSRAVERVDGYGVRLSLDTNVQNIVEREGLSIRHRAQFVLIGSGNPEEGELRPQLLDRFGLSVEVRSPKDIEVRIEIMRLVAANEADPEAFAARFAEEDDKILKRVAKGKARLAKLEAGEDVLRDAANLCLAVGADGLRGELTLMRAARALAALDGAKKVTRKHLVAIAPSALRHRLRRDVLDETGSTARITRAIAELFG